MKVRISFKDAMWIVEEAARQEPALYGQKYLHFVLSKMTLCEDCVLLEMSAEYERETDPKLH